MKRNNIIITVQFNKNLNSKFKIKLKNYNNIYKKTTADQLDSI